MTHAEQEQQLHDYITAFRDVINLKKFADRAETSQPTLDFFLKGQRKLTPDVLSRCQEVLREQAKALQAFL